MGMGSAVPQPLRLTSAKGRVVLVVDDDAVVLATMAEVLRDAGYTVMTAEDGAQALQRIAEIPPSVVLLDMWMPVMDGGEFASTVRARGSQAKIVVMTAAQDARALAAQIHADGYLAKPFTLQELLALLDRAA
jgi:CheY-like chemotaxis protein